MRTLRSQRGFLLNPYRFAGTTQSGAFAMTGTGASVFTAAAIATADASATASAALTFGTDQAGSGALSITGQAAATLAGAAISASAVSANGAGALTIYASAGSATVDAADYDGTNDYLSRASNFTGATNSKPFVLSLWVKFDSLATRQLLRGNDSVAGFGPIDMSIDSGGSLEINCNGTAGTSVRVVAVGALSAGVWRHILFATTGAANQLYIGDAAVSPGTDTANNINTNWGGATSWNVGANSSGLIKMDGGMAELYLAPGQTLDISIEANRRKFIDASGKPVNLGLTGETPTGTAPLLYLHLDDAETANNFAINRGTGGNLTVTGALTTYASSPSD